jgi:hypothetical protein
MLSEIVSEAVVMPMGDNPRKSPDIPAILKLSATDKTAFSIKSSFPSLNKRFTRQYPGRTETKMNPKKLVKTENSESLGIKYTKINVKPV